MVLSSVHSLWDAILINKFNIILLYGLGSYEMLAFFEILIWKYLVDLNTCSEITQKERLYIV